MDQAKIAGVCAAFARHLGWDLTLVRVLWVILSFWPMPLFGVIGYIVAWIALPKDPVTSVQLHAGANGAASQLPPTNPGV